MEHGNGRFLVLVFTLVEFPRKALKRWKLLELKKSQMIFLLGHAHKVRKNTVFNRGQTVVELLP